MSIQKDTKPQVRCSADNMEAFLMLPIPEPDHDHSVADVMAALEAKGVKSGVDQDAILKLLENKIYAQERRVAVGKEPVEGTEGYFDFLFNMDHNRKPKELPDGSVDYYCVNLISTVAEGDKIAVYHPAVQGKNGYNVKGAPIMAKRCKDLVPLKGKGFLRSPDGNEYYAEIPGKIDLSAGRLTISPTYEISGDADLTTGHIDFVGDVAIHGAVRNGISIKATGTITIDGIVESASLEAGKDIVLKSGLMGNSQAVIRTRGNLFAKFIEYASVDVRGTINAEVLLNCDVVCGERIVIAGKRGNIVGGKASAIGGVIANSIGNEMETKTVIAVGAEVEVYRRVKVLEHKIDAAQKAMTAIDDQIAEIERLETNKSLVDKPKQDPRKVTLLRMKIKENTSLQHDKLELDEMMEVINRAENASVIVYGKIYPGAMIHIDDILHTVKDWQEAVEYVKSMDSIVMRRVEDSI